MLKSQTKNAAEPHRELCRRQHRLLGHYLALYAWVKNLDCVALSRQHLQSFLGIERFKTSRLEWLKEDIKPWFSFTTDFWRGGGLNPTFASIFLSRISLDGVLPAGAMTTEQRIAKIATCALRAGLFQLKKRAKAKGPFPAEGEIIAFLAKVSVGIEPPTLIDNLKPGPRPPFSFRWGWL
jgi:hypothetical protein